MRVLAKVPVRGGAQEGPEEAALEGRLDEEWAATRRLLLGACLLQDAPDALPGRGYTGHCFADWNHVDCCTMQGAVASNENEGRVQGIAYGNQLGPGIQLASVAGGEGGSGSWCTCQLGAHRTPPSDVCHVQFRARVGFKLVWCPTDGYRQFVLADDDGAVLARGRPSGELPSITERRRNYEAVRGSAYARGCTNASTATA